MEPVSSARVLCARALTEGWAEQVINFDKLTYAGNLENLPPVADHTGYRFVQGDICDAEAVETVLREEAPDADRAFCGRIAR